MLTVEVRSAVETAPPSKKLSFVFFVRPDDVLAHVSSLPNVTERRQALKDMYRAAKAPVRDAIDHTDNLRIVDPLDGTPSMIVAGPASAWRRLFEGSEVVATDPDVEVMPNTENWATTPASP